MDNIMEFLPFLIPLVIAIAIGVISFAISIPIFNKKQL